MQTQRLLSDLHMLKLAQSRPRILRVSIEASVEDFLLTRFSLNKLTLSGGHSLSLFGGISTTQTVNTTAHTWQDTLLTHPVNRPAVVSKLTKERLYLFRRMHV